MKDFLKYISGVVLLILGTSYVLDVIYTEAFKNNKPRNKVQLVANLTNTHIDYIFLGSSRVENHIDCDQIEKLTGKSCINLGLQGGRLKDYRVIAYLLKNNKVTYEKIFVQVDYSYNFDNYSPLFLAQVGPFVNRNNFPELLKEELQKEVNSKIPFVRYALNEKIIGFRETLSQFFKKGVNVDLQNGFVPLEGVGTAISGHFPDSINYPNLALEDIITLDPNNTILFAAPYCNSSKTRNDFMSSLQIKYPSLQNYIDIFDNIEGISVNCGHLNANGAQIFTGILTKDILLD